MLITVDLYTSVLQLRGSFVQAGFAPLICYNNMNFTIGYMYKYKSMVTPYIINFKENTNMDMFRFVRRIDGVYPLSFRTNSNRLFTYSELCRMLYVVRDLQV